MNQTDRDRFTPIPNPYIVGNPIEDRRMFFGREDDFAFIRTKVAGGGRSQIIVLCGTRRSGKTSILFQIKNGRLGDEFIPVLIDMQAMTVQSDGEFLGAIAGEVVTAVDSPRVSFERDYLARAAENPYNAFQNLIEKLGDALAGRKLVLMFDEYELFETHIDKGRFSTDILRTLASWMESQQGVFIIFTGSDRLENRQPRYWEILGKALHRRISFLSTTDTQRLVNEPLAGIVRHEKGVPESIFELTAGQPFYTQVICQTIVDRLNEVERYNVTHDDIQNVVNEIIDNPLPQMIFSWSSLSGMEKLVLSVTAELSKEEEKRDVDYRDIIEYAESERIGYRLDENTLRESIERLFIHDLLDKDPQSGRYRFKMDLWRQWTLRMHSLWQVIDELKSAPAGPGEGIVPVRTRPPVPKWLVWTGAIFIIAISIYAFFTARTYFANPGREPTPVPQIDSTFVSIVTEPPGARIFLDRTLVGTSPLVDFGTPAGRSVLEIELAGYRAYIDTVLLEKNDTTAIAVTLHESVGDLAIASSPTGASIVLDDKRTGLTTPATIRGLSVNELHSVRLYLDGYSTAREGGIRIIEDSVRVVRLDLSRRTHPLTVITTPAGAEVSLDGRPVGTTPMNLDAVTEGSHTVSVGREGYKTVSRTIGVPVRRNMVEVALEPLPPGTIVFVVLPYAELLIDGELIAPDVTHRQVELTPGEHHVTLSHPIYGSIEETVNVVSGETVTKRYDMEERGGQ